MEHAHTDEPNHVIASMDTLGIAASSLCLVHCLAMPLVVGILPLVGLKFLEGHPAHVTLAFFVLTFALLAIVPGYLKHRRGDILAMMLVGVGLVLYATFLAQFTLGESAEIPIITVGNLILVFTHLRNRALHKCTVHSHK
ncbi:MAG TPA: MerC domain-containing protein [Trichormus sp.]